MSDIEKGPLVDLAKAMEDVLPKFEASQDHALFTLGVEHRPDAEGNPNIYTFITGSGDRALLAEGLYAELREQIEEGNRTLFYIFTEVLQDIMEDLNIGPEPEADEDVGPTFH